MITDNPNGCARKGRIQMSFDEALNILNRDERFKATVYAMNTLLIRKGIYTAEEFERLFCQHAENYERGFAGKAKVQEEASSLASLASP